MLGTVNPDVAPILGNHLTSYFFSKQYEITLALVPSTSAVLKMDGCVAIEMLFDFRFVFLGDSCIHSSLFVFLFVLFVIKAGKYKKAFLSLGNSWQRTGKWQNN